MFDWTESYSLGVPSIDEQHKKLVSMGKDLEHLVLNAEGQDIYDELISMLEGLTEYTRIHFDYEEKLMEENGFDGIEDHKIQHNEFIEKLEAVNFDDVDDAQDEFAKNLLKMVSVWIFKHIVGTDAKYKVLFNDKGVQ